ncbi:hypothetical protein [Clostridium uliginosum]|uniref:Uncharacterized protein n=1 Tax=Clostridium uliginosum TaxID=119641 RepID=A0A1I1R2A5_9CLOT|nr:hypothetical protein [Clostridium uliginosum]SFD25663.1 hypothetical protein SAMN05421842_12754 [Clostridium uliginosum]
MKISDKFFKRYTFLMCFFPIIYWMISDIFNANKYIKFLTVIFFSLFTMLLDIEYRITNKPLIKKDLIQLILWNLIIVIMLIYWYIRFVY